MAQEEKKPLKDAGKPRKEGKVLPQEPTDIFALDSKSGAHLGKPGTKHTVHAVLAQQLVDKGAASFDEPKGKPAKVVKLTAAELKDLKAVVGHEPTDDEISEAVKAKAEGEKD